MCLIQKQFEYFNQYFFAIILLIGMNRVIKAFGICRRFQFGFSEVTKGNNTAPVKRRKLQFSKHQLVDFGELPHGEIPQALKYVRPSSVTKLTNNVRVVTENLSGPQSSITVLVKAGSRQETLANSSVANFAAHTALHGTSKYSREKIEEIVDSLGGNLDVKVSRELSEFTLSFNNGNLTQAIDLISEIVLNPTYDQIQIQAAKVSIHKNATSMDPWNVSMDAIHFAAYRDHYLGQPASGNRDIIYSITADQVKQYHNNFYVGSNIVVSGAGALDSKAFTDEVANKFGSLPTSRISIVPNSEKPYLTPSLMFQRDDELYNTCFAVAFEAPSWNDPDYFAMNYFKRIIGEWRCDKYNGQHLNSAHLQYNSFHTYLGNYPDIILHRPFYFAYSDTGLYGNFIYGNELFSPQMHSITQNQMSIYAQYIHQSEVFRARNQYFNDLLEFNDSSEVSSHNSQQVAYIDRLISRAQTATRITNMTAEYITKVAKNYFFDKQTVITAYGNLHSTVINAHYNRTFRRATLGLYSQCGVRLTY